VALSAWLKAKTKNEKLGGAIDLASSLASTLVAEAEQLLAPRLAEAMKDGKIDAAEKAPFACPDDCLFFEPRSITDAGWSRAPEEP
jgi:hypothetical protein